ncbi:hypothetical protein MFLAVUS_008022 [Mucor flavus]|uniref:Uncharacterized protein n=1 Tax=Mucor flavus TaxID=439312 RepID=A0ABP9Z5X7_9FUNG
MSASNNQSAVTSPLSNGTPTNTAAAVNTEVHTTTTAGSLGVENEDFLLDFDNLHYGGLVVLKSTLW